MEVSLLFFIATTQSNVVLLPLLHCTKKWSFLLRIFSGNVTKSADSWGFGHIYWRNLLWKTSFLVQCCWLWRGVYQLGKDRFSPFVLSHCVTEKNATTNIGSKFFSYHFETPQKMLMKREKWTDIYRSSHPEVFCKQGVSQNLQENACTRVSFYWSCRPYVCNFIKRDSSTGVFL